MDKLKMPQRRNKLTRYLDVDWSKYARTGFLYSYNEIAKKEGVSYFCVWSAFKRYGIPKPDIHKYKRVQAQQYVNSNHSYQDIADRLKIDRRTVRRAFKEKGIIKGKASRVGKYKNKGGRTSLDQQIRSILWQYKKLNNCSFCKKIITVGDKWIIRKPVEKKRKRDKYISLCNLCYSLYKNNNFDEINKILDSVIAEEEEHKKKLKEEETERKRIEAEKLLKEADEEARLSTE
jgi:hypothetical protein